MSLILKRKYLNNNFSNYSKKYKVWVQQTKPTKIY